MDLRTYQEKAIRTMKYLGTHSLLYEAYHYKFIINQENAPKVACRWDHAHMVIGMSSELNELDDAIRKEDLVNIEEEVADIMWYAANEATLAKISIVAQLDLGTFYYTDLVHAISDYNDLLKKFIVYGREILEHARAEKLQKIVTICYNFSGMMIGSKIAFTTIDLPKALSRNIAKLEARYPDKFTDEAANNRDLDKERKALEGND